MKLSFFALGWRTLWRDVRSGELRLLILAVTLAVAALTAVGFFADRLQGGLQRDARALIGGDAVIQSDQPAPPAFAAEVDGEILGTAQLGSAILTEASLSFLGLGIPEPYPSWGRMLSESAAEYVRTAPWLVIFPGVAISLTVFGTNLLGDALRDILDPRQRT